VPYTLLLADDSVTIQRVIELTFADEDVVVVAVSDGDQAIARLEASPPDIVLADIGMPGKNGYEVAQYMRRSPRLAHIPVVLLTGAFEPVDQARAAEAGCDGVLAKPFEPQLVIGRVKELLARNNRPSSSPAPDGPRQPAVPVEQWAPPPAESLVATGSGAPAAPVALNDYFDRLDAAFSNVPAGPSAAPLAATAAPAADIDWFTAAASETPSKDAWDFAGPTELTEPPELPLAYTAPQPAVSPLPSFVPPPPAEPPPPAASAGPAALAVFDAGAAPAPPAPPPQATASAHVAALADFAPDAVSEPFAPAAPAVPSERVAPFAPPAPAARAASVPPVRPAGLPPLADAFAALLAAEQQDPAPVSAPRWPGTTASTAHHTDPSSAAAGGTDALVEDVTRRVLERLSDQVVRETVAEIVSKVAEQLVREEIERIKASVK
jgi:CheY-like chemotaxis protein